MRAVIHQFRTCIGFLLCIGFRRSTSDPADAGPPSPREKVLAPLIRPFEPPGGELPRRGKRSRPGPSPREKVLRTDSSTPPRLRSGSLRMAWRLGGRTFSGCPCRECIYAFRGTDESVPYSFLVAAAPPKLLPGEKLSAAKRMTDEGNKGKH